MTAQIQLFLFYYLNYFYIYFTLLSNHRIRLKQNKMHFRDQVLRKNRLTLNSFDK
jgi:hypothetical protein